MRPPAAWTALLAVAALLVAGCGEPKSVDVYALPPAVPAPLGPPERTPAPGVHPYGIDVGGELATGLLAVPDGPPAALVVVAHGWGGSAAAHREDLATLAAAGALAVAMDYRGPDAAFKVQAGVEDTVAATLDLQSRWPGVNRTLAYGWSMGGEVALLAAMAAPAGTYDYVFVGAGVADLADFWNASAFAREALERETGGPPDAAGPAYHERSPLDRAAELADKGVRRVLLVHGVADEVVAPEQAWRMAEALRGAGVPTSAYAVTQDVPPGCVAGDCAPAPATHWAGRLQPMLPFLLPRLRGAADPADAFVEGTYDAAAGRYEPPDVPAPA